MIETHPEMKLPLPPINTNKMISNVSYGELQNYSFEELSNWVDELRNELLEMWDDGLPPHIGMDKEIIIKRFNKLKDYDLSKIYTQDELYPDYWGFIKNFSKMGNGVNQFFPALLKSRVNGISIHDYLSNENLWLDFKYNIVQKVRFDKMFLYTKYYKIGDWSGDYVPEKGGSFHPHGFPYTGSDLEDFEVWYDKKSEKIDFWLENANWNKKNEKWNRYYITTENVKKLQERGILGEPELVNDVGFKKDGDKDGYVVRYYDKTQKVFPKLFQILRIGLNQVAVNFPVLTARWIYERYLTGLPPQTNYKVYDSSAGWGSRLLGSLCSELPIHYIGTDVNTENRGCYEDLGRFYNSNCNGRNTYEIYYEGSEVIGDNPKFQKHINDVDLIFTSPPYFNREIYSTDKEQSCLKYPTYPEWLDGYLDKTLKTSYEFLKPERYCIINIADIKIGEKKFYPLEQDTISLAVKNGFSYQGKLGMCMTRMVGLNPTDSKNYWFDMKSKSTYKIEPILVFKKKINYPWEENE